MVDELAMFMIGSYFPPTVTKSHIGGASVATYKALNLVSYTLCLLAINCFSSQSKLTSQKGGKIQNQNFGSLQYL